MARVLVVDDDLDLLKMIAFRLRGHGHRVVAATSGAGALKTLRAMDVPDVMVVDVSMAEMDGLTLVATVRESESMRRLPVIFLSSRDTADDIAAGRALDAWYLTKPLVTADLLALIEEATGGPASSAAPAEPAADASGSPAARR